MKNNGGRRKKKRGKSYQGINDTEVTGDHDTTNPYVDETIDNDEDEEYYDEESSEDEENMNEDARNEFEETK